MSFTVRKGGGGRATVYGTSDKFLNAKIKNRTLDAKLVEHERQIDKRKENELRILKHEQEVIAEDLSKTRNALNRYTRAGLNHSRLFNPKSPKTHNDRSKTHPQEKDAVDEALQLLAYKTRRRSSSAGAADMPTKRPLQASDPIKSDIKTPDFELDGAISKLAYKSHRRSSSVGDINVSVLTTNASTTEEPRRVEEEEDLLESTFDSLLKRASYRSRRRTSSAGAADMIRPNLAKSGKDHREISQFNESKSRKETSENENAEDVMDATEELERFQKLRCCLRRKSKSLNDISILGLRNHQKADTGNDVRDMTDGLDQLLNEVKGRVKKYQQCYKERFGVMSPIQAFHEENSDIQSENGDTI
ncbi:unnamed protein product [Owenia fusiformis]|uniref:Uncharacterized protein n=1 Tax=Owenia fusiformis TaxID=6347 RepID=A0A8J1TB82_OWEFU|nr:unnamed protein product [Owenia fusiformis]